LGHYIANVRDIEFNLFEVLNLGDVLASGGYGDLDVDTVRTMLDEVARLAEGPVAASFAAADQLEKCLQAGFDEIVELGRRTS